MEPLIRPLCPLCGQGNTDFSEDGRCSDCPPGEPWFEAARASVVFDGMAAVVVKRLKYSTREEFAPFMAARMLDTLAEEYRGRVFDLVVPVPLHRSREGDRGFNQSLLLAEVIAAGLNLPCHSKALRRIRATPSQTRLTRDQRANNISGAFAVSRPLAVRDKRLLLVDDVFTTGATLNECARMLRAAGAASVVCLAFARTRRGDLI